MIPVKRKDMRMPVIAPWCFWLAIACRLVSISVMISPKPRPTPNSETPIPAMPLGRRKAPMNAMAIRTDPVRTRGRIPSL